MRPTLLCGECERKLTETAVRMRRHASEMHRAVVLARTDKQSEHLELIEASLRPLNQHGMTIVST